MADSGIGSQHFFRYTYSLTKTVAGAGAAGFGRLSKVKYLSFTFLD